MRGWRVRDPEAAALRACTFLLMQLSMAKQPPRLAVPGGRTPGRILELFAANFPSHLPGLEILFVDERDVPLEDPESNFRLVKEKLLDPLGERAPRVYPMHVGDGDLDRAAREYESHVEVPLSLVLLGVGEDGHIASLFPHSPLLDERERRVMPVFDSPKPPARRLTLTPRVLDEATLIMVVATGAGKREAVARALGPDGDVHDCPARIARDAMWIVDEEAAGDLAEDVLLRS